MEIPENNILYSKYGLFEKFPSTGLQIINMVAEKYDEVAYIGFDFESANHQHYWQGLVSHPQAERVLSHHPKEHVITINTLNKFGS